MKEKVSVILADNVDTLFWIEKLKSSSTFLVVVDYDFTGDYEKRGGVLFMSPKYASQYFKGFSSITYYRSMYIYPGTYT